MTIFEKDPDPLKISNRASGIMKTGNSKDTDQQEILEPVTSFSDEGKFIHIITELPGIAEEKIRIDLEKTTITIVASDNCTRYKKVIIFPVEVLFSKKRFSEGELHLTVEKKGPDNPPSIFR